MTVLLLGTSSTTLTRRLLGVFAALFLLVGCATQQQTTADQWAQASGEAGVNDVSDNDPLEFVNRFVFAINDALDVIVFQPAAATYRFLLPSPVRNSVRSFFRNLNTPVILANDLFQLQWERAEDTFVRFVINSTVGLLGLFDVADGWGYPYHDEDFGQTLGAHGVGEGFYLVLPVLGPSSVRDGVGILVDNFLDPLTYIDAGNNIVGDDYEVADAQLTKKVLSGIDLRSRHIEDIEEIKRDAVDYYARMRSLYRQFRQNEINNGEATDELPVPGLAGEETESDQIGKTE